MLTIAASQSSFEIQSDSANATTSKLKGLIEELHNLKGSLNDISTASNTNQLIEQRLKNKLKTLQLHIEQLKSELYPDITA